MVDNKKNKRVASKFKGKAPKKSVGKSTKKNITAKANLEPAIIELPEIMDIVGAEEFLGQLKDMNNSGVDIVLDGNNIERLTTPCVQLMLSASVTAESNGVSFIVKNPSDVMFEVFEDIGLSDRLAQWVG